MEFQRRFLPIPKQSFFLFGLRGTGKSTWLKHLFPEALFVFCYNQTSTVR